MPLFSAVYSPYIIKTEKKKLDNRNEEQGNCSSGGSLILNWGWINKEREHKDNGGGAECPCHVRDRGTGIKLGTLMQGRVQ